MPDRFKYETAKALFAESELLKVRKDGVWLREKRVPRVLSRSERGEFLEHPHDALWVPGKPDPASLPVLPIPFTAAELAACFLVGAGALYASERFGDMGLRVLSKRALKAQKDDLEKALQTLDCGPAAKAAVREAYAELRGAAEVVGTLQMRYSAIAQRKERRREDLLRRARKNLSIDVDLARVNDELDADLSDQKSKLDEVLAPFKDGVAAGDEASIRQAVALREAAEVQASASHDAANLKRGEIRLELDKWKAKDIGYRNLCKAIVDTRKAAEVAEAIWLKDLLNHLIGDQADAGNAGQAPTPLAGQVYGQGNVAQQAAAVAQSTSFRPNHSDHPDDSLGLWSLKDRVLRDDGLTGAVHKALKAAHLQGKARPNAREVLDYFDGPNRPKAIVGVLADGCDYWNPHGEVESADIPKITKRIAELTTRQRAQKPRKAR